MKRIVLLLLAMLLGAVNIGAQTLQNSSYGVVGHMKSDGTVQDSSYRTIGHAKGVPMKWAAVFFFFWS